MTTTIGRTRGGIPRVPAVTLRAVLCALLAVVVTFAHDRTAAFGLVVLGVFLLVQAVLLVVVARAISISVVGRRLVLVRAVVSAAGGAVALASLGGGLDVLLPLQGGVFLLVGALEIIGGVRRAEAAETANDAVVVGGLQVLVGLMLVIMNPDAIFVVGVLGAWGAVVAVYLGIAAATLLRQDRRA